MTTSEQICLQNEIPIIVTDSIVLETYVKGQHVHKSVWSPIIGENLEVVTEPEPAVCAKKDGKIVGHLKKGNSGRYAKTFFYFLRSDPYFKGRNFRHFFYLRSASNLV